MWIFRLFGRLLEGNNGGGGGDAGGGGSGSGTGGQGGQGGQGGGQGGSIMSGQGGAGAGGQGGAGGAGGADGGGDGGQGGGGQGGDGGGQGGEQTWSWAEGITGTGERPPWFKADKYKTVDQQARAAVDLEAKLGPAAELIGAPEGDYAVPTLSEEAKAKIGGEFDTADPLYKMLATKAKELGLSQKAFDALAEAGALTIAEQNAADEQATADALAALGANVDARVADVERITKAIAGDDGFKALDAVVGNDVAAFVALEKILAKAATGAQLAGPGAGSGPAFSKADVEAEQFKVFPEGHHLAGKRMYDHDKEHRAKVDNMWKQLFPGEDRQQVG